MCRYFAALIAISALASPLAWGEQAFPYKAYVNSNEVYARSGPGKNYYPTTKMKQGDEVEVYRHDPGGWYAIRPPAGSYTWVSARYLEKGENGLARVAGDQVAARVGSQFSDARDVIQVRLHRGETVEILETKDFKSGPDSGTWYKIAPPSGEFRWVSGKYVEIDYPHDGVRRTTADNSPLIHPTAMSRPSTTASVAAEPPAAGLSPAPSWARKAESHETPVAMPVANEPAAPPANAYATRQLPDPTQPGARATRQSSPEEFQAELDRLDTELALMLVEEPSVWRFDEIGLRARDLVNQAETALERGRARQLVAKIEQSEDVKLRYDAVANLKTRTERENRQLADLSRTLTTPQQNLPSTDPRFDGSGRLARVVAAKPGTPQYALVDDKGDIQCYVSPAPGVNMQYYVGRKVGVTGERGYDTNARAQHVMAKHVTALENGGTTLR